ncbi:MAG: BlaI/MecI/CopY family transcriptional regulator [Planctomycetota bacterium]
MTDLPKAELEVMGCLWRNGPLLVAEIREQLSKSRPMSHASVSTLLKRLVAKGLVDREKASAGKAFVYRARVAPSRTQRQILGDLLQRVFDGSGVALVASLFETKPPTPDEIEQLQKLLDELKSESEED